MKGVYAFTDPWLKLQPFAAGGGEGATEDCFFPFLHPLLTISTLGGAQQ